MSAWSHAICWGCWEARAPGRQPVRALHPNPELCCLCRAVTTDGIYVRIDPAQVRCNGRHPKVYLCCLCHQVPVDAEAGYDTCPACLSRQ